MAHDDEEEVSEVVWHFLGRPDDEQAPSGREDQDREQGADAPRGQSNVCRRRQSTCNGGSEV